MFLYSNLKLANLKLNFESKFESNFESNCAFNFEFNLMLNFQNQRLITHAHCEYL